MLLLEKLYNGIKAEQWNRIKIGFGTADGSNETIHDFRQALTPGNKKTYHSVVRVLLCKSTSAIAAASSTEILPPANLSWNQII
jgi:hypothetical protein